jgi:hypothetical protein
MRFTTRSRKTMNGTGTSQPTVKPGPHSMPITTAPGRAQSSVTETPFASTSAALAPAVAIVQIEFRAEAATAWRGEDRYRHRAHASDGVCCKFVSDATNGPAAPMHGLQRTEQTSAVRSSGCCLTRTGRAGLTARSPTQPRSTTRRLRRSGVSLPLGKSPPPRLPRAPRAAVKKSQGGTASRTRNHAR